MPQSPSSRWCPTAEHLMMLEDIYRDGLRSPNAAQIQSIAAHLSLNGRIEGKNVFYWFQNHKARDRQKHRKRIFRQHHHHHHLPSPVTFSVPNQPSSQVQAARRSSLSDIMGVRKEIPEAMSLMGKHGKCEKEEASRSMADKNSSNEWMMLTSEAPPFLREPLKTLDLFPIRTDDIISNSFSFSPSTN